MEDRIIARETELTVVQAFIDRPTDRPRVLVLEGEPGIGKSTLWLAGVTAARQQFPQVLTSRPAETESSLANLVLADLFSEVSPSALAALPTPRRRALESALLIGEAEDQEVDPRALGAAVLTILTSLAAEGPLLLAIDDDQWSDASSIASLAFALRRLRRERILLLLSRRVDGGSTDGIPAYALEATIETQAVERARVGPLSAGAIQLLLRSRLGIALSRPRLLRLHEASGGNPFFALELARALSEAGDPTAPLIVPPNLERLLAGRLRGLDRETRQALLLVAAHGRAPLELLRRLGVRPRVMDQAAAEQLVESSGGAIRFTHPLLASTAYQRASPGERRAAHLRLAAVVDDPIGRTRHLALGTLAPDEKVAAALESAANVGRARGMPIAAAELAEHAMRLTPPGQVDGALRRGAIAARAHLEAGDPGRARVIISAQLANAPRGPRRAEALILGSELEEPGPAVALLQEGLREAAGTPAVRAAIHTRLGDVGRFVKGRDWAERQVRAALLLADRLKDERLQVGALAVLAVLRFEDVDPSALDLAREAQRRALALADPEITRVATWVVGHQLAWLRRNDEARDWLERALVEAADRDELLRAECLWYLSLVELWSGRWDVAWEHAQESADINLQYGIERPPDHMPQALIALYRGQFALAREHSTRALSLAEGMMLPTHTAVLGIADLWSGRPDSALAKLASAEDLEIRRGSHEAPMFSGRAEHVEALLQLARIDDADRLVAGWEVATIPGQHEWTMAEVVRSKGLVAAARGELDRAVNLLQLACRRHEAAGDPFGRGRALLALGVVHRRLRRKRAAREAIEAAIGQFETLGAASWAAAARGELGRIGGQRRIEGLSPSERRVAELVVEGRTNREIAAALFLGERTVASHLTHVYAKLGIRSRTELARHLRSEPTNIQTF
jgi:DNA-binding CsgD family transcriptional regulator